MKKRIVKKIFSLAAALVMLFAMAIPAGATGNHVILSPDLPPAISVNSGMEVMLEVAVSGDIPVEFQWCYADGTPIPNAPNSNQFKASYYQNTAVYCNVVCQTTVVRSNTCYVTINGSGSTLPQPDGSGSGNTGSGSGSTGGGSTLVPPTSGSLTAPIITRQPAGVVLGMGQAATLSVEAAINGYYPGVQLRYQWYKSGTNNATLAAPISGATSSSYTTSPYDGSQYYLVAVWATDGTNTSTTTYSSMAAVSYGDMFKITKQPTGETVKVGESALFIARADASVGHEWRIVSKDTTRTVPATQAAYYFPGLNVSGEQTDTLALSNIPAELDGWSVECKFAGPDGSVLYSNGAILRVMSATPSPSPTPAYGTATPTPTPAASSYIPGSNALTAPRISSQPVGAVLAEGETVTLSVAAEGADAAKGVQLSYQWYRSERNSNANGTPISGATSASYVPDTISGSRYYYCGVTAKNSEGETKTTYSSPATVTYTAPINTPAPTATPVPTKAPVSSVKNPGLGSMIIAPIIAIVAAAAAIGVGMFFLLKNVGGSKKKSDFDRDYFDEDDYWRDDERPRR